MWQLADSAFPSGSFAHSGGLEAAWQQGEIPSSNDLFAFAQANLVQSGWSAVPFLNEAFHKPVDFSELDRLNDVFLSNHVANRASRAQGRAWLLAIERIFPSPGLVNFRSRVQQEALPGHVAPVFGFLMRNLEVKHHWAVRLFLFMNLRGIMAAAVRLGIVGPLEGQSRQAQLAVHAESVATRCSELRVDDVAQTAPFLDILQGGHDRLYSRLFQT